ncbi:MAG: hypothetical protein HQL63_15415 [Magnetococcales bacterium]|nr:hypothetical protein [Magnetococcales bacterium]MBF0322917.1 hypothetical protein [Magnetococcales bacterium]
MKHLTNRTYRVSILAALTGSMACAMAAGSALAEWNPQPAVHVGYTMIKVKTWRYDTGYENPVQHWWERTPAVGDIWHRQPVESDAQQPVSYIRRTPVEVMVPQAVMAPVPVAAGGSTPARVRVQPTFTGEEPSAPEGFIMPQTVVIYR